MLRLDAAHLDKHQRGVVQLHEGEARGRPEALDGHGHVQRDVQEEYNGAATFAIRQRQLRAQSGETYNGCLAGTPSDMVAAMYRRGEPAAGVGEGAGAGAGGTKAEASEAGST